MGRLHGAASGGTTVIGGGAGFASATLIKSFGLQGGRALLAAGVANAVDFGVGAAADHYLLGDSWGTAVFGNALGFGIGEAAGFFGKGAFRIGGGLLGNAWRGSYNFRNNLALRSASALLGGVHGGGAGRSSQLITLSRGTTIERQIRTYTDSGFVMSDAAIEFYEEAILQGKSIGEALEYAGNQGMRIHQQNLEFYGSIERYARSHNAGDGKGLTGMRTLISFTTDDDVLETFGGRDWSVFVNVDLANNPQIYHLGGEEAEYLVPVMIKWRGKGGIINLGFDW